MTTRTSSQLGAVALLGLICTELVFRLSLFPGLHGDEAWQGLAALNSATGRTLHGMNDYTGSLFAHLVAAQFSFTGVNVFSLRLPGAVCNGLAMILTAAALWRRGHAAFFILILFASSLLFLFYSRVAWEVTALQNVLLAVILAALGRILSAARAAPGWTFLFFFAFALGTWNHFIFLVAVMSLALASTFLLLRRPDEQTGRLFALTMFNLPLLAVLAGISVLTPNGDFISHGLPALLIALGLVAATSTAFVRYEPRLSSWLAQFPNRKALLARRMYVALVVIAAAGLLFCLPLDGVSFFGTLSGYILQERIVSYVSPLPEAIAQHAAMILLLGGFLMAAWRAGRQTGRTEVFPALLLLWTVLSLPILRLAALHAPDRYFIIPQFLFFYALVMTIESLTLPWRRMMQAAAAFLFLHSQQFFWSVVESPAERPPLDYHYGLYEDTSRHFMSLAPLRAYLAEKDICTVQSPAFFIDQPLRFLAATGPACRGGAAARVDYCDSCRSPVPWFRISPVQPGKASTR